MNDICSISPPWQRISLLPDLIWSMMGLIFLWKLPTIFLFSPLVPIQEKLFQYKRNCVPKTKFRSDLPEKLILSQFDLIFPLFPIGDWFQFILFHLQIERRGRGSNQNMWKLQINLETFQAVVLNKYVCLHFKPRLRMVPWCHSKLRSFVRLSTRSINIIMIWHLTLKHLH